MRLNFFRRKEGALLENEMTRIYCLCKKKKRSILLLTADFFFSNFCTEVK